MLPFGPFYRHGGTHVMLRGDDHPLHRSAVANPSHSDAFRDVVRDNPIFHRPYRVFEVRFILILFICHYLTFYVAAN